MFDMKGLDQCDQHHKLLEFFCEDEDQLCFSTCAIVDHRKCHNVVEVQKIAGKFTSQGSSLKGEWQEAKENAEYLVKSIISSKGQVQLDAKKIPGTIRQMRDKVIEKFEDSESSVVKEVEDLKTETIAELNKKQTKNEGYVVDAT
ncbi:zinc-binding protein A33-like [Ruditapes philippinarum]|uniref:zinc-binding protein A33-like n=1 Tax=Ruditapes philippinarum TaxID=129788 RepID=UPI00295BEC70|nr:zinc-binding protein A33-like [Ruditapes philippinarum]